ncbi:MAG: 16S rRNA (guanine(966)-N(2))-methyltransferase RsmD [Pedobacter sp.]
MRVIAGSARGTRLAAPRGTHTRPTADRVREALFSIIQSRFALESARVLDICAGTGSLGIEALSRGAASCCFIENDRNALVVLNKNLSAVRYDVRADLLELDAIKALNLLAAQRDQFDIVFFDPPYASNLYFVVAETLCNRSLLKVGGLFVTESDVRNPLPDHVGKFVKSDHRIYGDTVLDFYTLERE